MLVFVEASIGSCLQMFPGPRAGLQQRGRPRGATARSAVAAGSAKDADLLLRLDGATATRGRL